MELPAHCPVGKDLCRVIKGSIEPNKASFSVHFFLCILISGALAVSALQVFSKDTSNRNCLTWFSYYISLCVSYPKSRGVQYVIIINCMKQHSFKQWARHDFKRWTANPCSGAPRHCAFQTSVADYCLIWNMALLFRCLKGELHACLW